MQAIIMAAGKGSRLGELTRDRPKAFLEIQGIPLLDYNIGMLHHFGIRDIVVVTGYECMAFENHLKDIEGIRMVYNPFYDQTNVIGSFYIGQGYLKETDTAYLHADTLCDPEIFEEMIRGEGDIVLPVDYKECDEEAMKIRSANGKVAEISKQISCDIAEGEFIGIAKIAGQTIEPIRNAAKKLMMDNRMNEYFEAAIQAIIDQGGYDITTVPTAGRFWGEVDFIEDFEFVRDNMPDRLRDMAL